MDSEPRPSLDVASMLPTASMPKWSLYLAASAIALNFSVLAAVVIAGPFGRQELRLAGAAVLACAMLVSAAATAMHVRNVARWHINAAHRAELERRARRDDLSGLFNVRYLRERMHAEVAECARNGGSFSLLLFDLDNFKDVNDRLGHSAGDSLIAAIGEAIAHEVGEGGVAARQGGDEFAVLLPRADAAEAAELATRIVRAVGMTSVSALTQNEHLPVGASWGVATYPSDGGDVETLCASADRSLYRAKGKMANAYARTAEGYAQEAFFAIGDAMGTSVDAPDRLNSLCRAISLSLNLDACSIWLVNDTGLVQPRAYHSHDEAIVERFAGVVSREPITRIEAVSTGLLKRQPVYVDDVTKSDVMPPRYRELIPPGSWLVSVPIPDPREGMLLMLASHDRSEPPASGLALAVARMLATSIRNADVYDRARKQNEKLAALAGVGGLLFDDDVAGEFEERLDAVVRRLVEVTGYDMITFDTSDPTERQPFCRSFFGRGRVGEEFDPTSAHVWKSLRPALTEPGIVEFLAKVNNPIVLDDPAAQAPEIYREAIAQSGTRCVVVMPVNWRGEVMGLFYFASYRPQAFDQHDIALMGTIAALLAPSIEVAKLHAALEQSYGELKDAHLQALFRLAYAAEARDPYTECHLSRIRAISIAVGRRMGIEGEALEGLGYGAIVHDLGKLRIPDSILTNPGRLSDAEWQEMKKHPQWGAEIIGTNAFYETARIVALNHHERWDGSGYPAGLAEEDIPLPARIVSVADVYDALTSARPYKSAWPVERALVELMRMRGKTLCPHSVDVFMELWREGEIARIDAETGEEALGYDFRDLYAA